LRAAARAAGEPDLTPSWLARADADAVSDIISMCNYRNTKAKAIVQVAADVKRARNRVATTVQGYTAYRGVGKELSALLKLVNEPATAREWCDKEAAALCGGSRGGGGGGETVVDAASLTTPGDDVTTDDPR